MKKIIFLDLLDFGTIFLFKYGMSDEVGGFYGKISPKFSTTRRNVPRQEKLILSIYPSTASQELGS